MARDIAYQKYRDGRDELECSREREMISCLDERHDFTLQESELFYAQSNFY